MKALAFMQNQWFAKPDLHALQMRRAMDRGLHEYWRHRASFIRRALFFRCRSGQVLRAQLSEPLCNQIIWDEASPEIHDNPRTIPAADLIHMRTVLDWHKPEVVITFGRVARIALEDINPVNVILIHSPHPACRAPADHVKLKEACQRIVELLK